MEILTVAECDKFELELDHIVDLHRKNIALVYLYGAKYFIVLGNNDTANQCLLKAKYIIEEPDAEETHDINLVDETLFIMKSKFNFYVKYGIILDLTVTIDTEYSMD